MQMEFDSDEVLPVATFEASAPMPSGQVWIAPKPTGSRSRSGVRPSLEGTPPSTWVGLYLLKHTHTVCHHGALRASTLSCLLGSSRRFIWV